MAIIKIVRVSILLMLCGSLNASLRVQENMPSHIHELYVYDYDEMPAQRSLFRINRQQPTDYQSVGNGGLDYNERPVPVQSVGVFPSGVSGTIPGFSLSTWPQGTIPYEIDSSFEPFLVHRIKSAMVFLMSYQSPYYFSCIHFREKVSTDQHFVRFQKVDRTSNCRTQFIGFRSAGSHSAFIGDHCSHESYIYFILLQILGLPAEHQRPDRDQYITVQWQNILPNFTDNFKIYQSMPKVLLDQPYDAMSRLHYQNYYLSKNNEMTIAYNGNRDAVVGNALGPSVNDMFKISLLYCPTAPPNPERRTLIARPMYNATGDQNICQCIPNPGDYLGDCIGRDGFMWQSMLEQCRANGTNSLPLQCRCSEAAFNVSYQDFCYYYFILFSFLFLALCLQTLIDKWQFDLPKEMLQ